MEVQSILSGKFAQALVKAQGEIEGAKKGKTNPAFRSKYADLGACWDACRDALQDNGIAVLQIPTEAAPGYVGLRTMLVFGPTGETLSETASIPIKDASNPQAYGSALTYVRRYALCSFIGICPEDDDGNKASQQAQPAPANYRPTSSNAESTTASVQSYTATFGSKQTVDAMKAVYSEVKASSLDEPAKTALLKQMADAIKAKKAEETK